MKIFGALITLGFLTSGCQLSYYAKSAYHQAQILAAREPVEKYLQQSTLTDEQKRKLALAVEARDFAIRKLGLSGKNNYTEFVQLDRPYVSWVVNAAHPWELKHHEFEYLVVGKMPYKGFFSESEAQAEKKILEKRGLDVHLRGVSAYSTLGWFDDPILSSMLQYKDHDLVNTIIHELVHATLYIKNSADFNERMAVFIGNLGTEMFYLEKEGPNSETFQKIKREYEDEKLFSKFISKELQSLEDFYKKLPLDQKNAEIKKQRLSEIKNRFQKEVRPYISENSFLAFEKKDFNNAYLILFKTYSQDLSLFEEAYLKLQSDLSQFLNKMRSLEKEKNPLDSLEKFVNSASS